MMLLLVFVVGCDEEPLPSRCEPDPDTTWGTFGAGFMAGRCAGCHGSGAPERHGAPAGVVFDSEADVWEQQAAVVDSVLTRGSMPPAGGLTEPELAHLKAWLACRP